MGLYDDLKGANAPVKLLVQVGVALALYAAGFRIENLTNPFGTALVLGAFSLPLTVLWVVDGLDGLAGVAPATGKDIAAKLARGRGHHAIPGL